MSVKMSWALAGKFLLALFIGGFAGYWIGDTAGAVLGFLLCLAVYAVEKRKAR